MRTEPHYQQSLFFSILEGDHVLALHTPIGEDHEGREHTLAAGAEGIVDHVDHAEHVVTVIYWIGGEHCIVQVYSRDDADLDSIQFVRRGLDTSSSASRQHFIDTGRHLFIGEADDA